MRYPYIYRVFDRAIRTSLRFPELSQIQPGDADFRFELNDLLPNPANLSWIHHWYQDKNKKRSNYSVGLTPDGYFFRFAAKANFRVSLPDRSIFCSPRSGTDTATIRHLLLDHVLPRLLVDDDELAIHASAIRTEDGRGVAFLGDSGWGKSTLAQSFNANGADLLGDDCLKLWVRGESLLGIASYSGCRLWSDSVQALFPGGVDALRMGEVTSKQRILRADVDGAEAVPIDNLFILNDPESYAGNEILIKPISGTQAMMELVKCSFMLDVGSKQTAENQFRTIHAILEAQPNVYSLGFPRDYHLLPEVRKKILSIVHGGHH